MRRLAVILAVVLASSATTMSYGQDAARGYAAAVMSPVVIQNVTARFQNDLRGLGVPADIQGCRLIEQVAVGVRNGEIAYGAACKMRIGPKPLAEFIICDSDLSGFGALYSGGFVDSQAWMDSFIRKNCF